MELPRSNPGPNPNILVILNPAFPATIKKWGAFPVLVIALQANKWSDLSDLVRSVFHLDLELIYAHHRQNCHRSRCFYICG